MPQGYQRYSNVFVGGHSNGGILLQTPHIEASAAGFVHLASLKLYNTGLWNDIAQVCGSLPTMFIVGQRDCVTEPANVMTYALDFISLAATVEFAEACRAAPVVVVEGMTHYSFLNSM